VHCQISQIDGRWRFELSDPKEVSSGHEMKCGHKEPDVDDQSWKAK